METLLDLPPLHIVIQGEARTGLLRLQNSSYPAKLDTKHITIGVTIQDSIFEMSKNYMAPKHTDPQTFLVTIEEGEEDIPPGSLVWYTDGSKKSGDWMRYIRGNAEGTTKLLSRQIHNCFSNRNIRNTSMCA